MTKYNKKIFASSRNLPDKPHRKHLMNLARKKILQPLMFRLVVPTKKLPKISVLFGQTNGHKSKRKALPVINRDVHFWKIWTTMEQKS